MKSPTEIETKRLINKRAVRNRLGNISGTTLWRLQQRGIIPKPIRLSKGLSMWPEAEIDAVISSLTTNRVR